jgi:hypothetical protein
MIPKSSQRGNAADLAAHLLNAEDNEFVEVMEMHGTIADDLTGGLREIEAAFLAVTKGKNPFFQMALSPQPGQAWNDDLTRDYVDRVLHGLNLVDQPRGLVRHIKTMPNGVSREHFHLVVSRLDIGECKAIPISFDRIKLMQITREFARDHGMELPPGYYNYADRQQQTYRQVSLYEKSLADRGHPSRAEHQEIITPLWQGRTTPEGFIKALDHHGYMLAYGRRPVVIDIFGKEHSLARLIADDDARVASIRAFLGDHYTEDDLPSVDEAKALAADHLAKTKQFELSETRAERMDVLKAGQAIYRQKIEAEIERRRGEDKAALLRADDRALNERRDHRSAFLEHRRETKARREAMEPTGLAAFLGRITGYALIQKKIHKHEDKKLFAAHAEARAEIIARQDAQREEMRLAHQMRGLDEERKLRELSYREAQEIRSLERQFEQEARLQFRENHPAPTPVPALELTPMGRRAAPAKAMNRYTGSSYQDRATPEEFKAQAQHPLDSDVEPPPLEPERHGDDRNKQHLDRAARSGETPPDRKPAEPEAAKEVAAKNPEPMSIAEVPTRTVSVNHDFQYEGYLRKQAKNRADELTQAFDNAANAQGLDDQESSSSGDAQEARPQPPQHGEVEPQAEPKLQNEFEVNQALEPPAQSEPATPQFDKAAHGHEPSTAVEPEPSPEPDMSPSQNSEPENVAPSPEIDRDRE